MFVEDREEAGNCYTGTEGDLVLVEPFIRTPLALDGWLEFNRLKWDVIPHKVRLKLTEKEFPTVEAVLYTDRKGRLRLPPRNPYLPISIGTSNTQLASRLYRQTVDAGQLLADNMKGRGLGGAISLDPVVQDVRPWVWNGFVARPSYTFHIDLPFDVSTSDTTFRKRVRAAERRGFYVRVHAPLRDVLDCLIGTEKRQGFSHRLALRDLEVAKDLLGEDYFRTYVAYDAENRPASARIALHYPGARAVGWVAGTKPEYLSDGVAQLVLAYTLHDLHQAGATSFDYAGANIRSVAAAKANAGGRLVTYYTIEQRSPKYLVKEFLSTARGIRRFGT